MELKIADTDPDAAQLVDQKVKEAKAWLACKWCKAEAANFVTGIFSDAVYCSSCGRYAGYSFPIGPVLHRLADTNVRDEKMLALLGLLEEWPGCRADMPVHIEAVTTYWWKDSPNVLQVWQCKELIYRQHEQSIRWSLGPVINQAVVARLGRVPEINFRDQFACPHCGASEDRQDWRNFNQVARLADIYCGECGKFIRTWDPS